MTARIQDRPQRVWWPASESLLNWGDDFHDLLLGDDLRMATYRAAISRAVRPGMVVVDVGTGTGILAKWALEAGASRVYGIDLNEKILQVATRRLELDGLAAGFRPLPGLSTGIELPEPADLIISEILGNLADNEGCVPILCDARRRMLRHDGIMLPRQVESFLAPVAAETAHAEIANGHVRGGSDTSIVERELSQRGGDGRFDMYYDAVIPGSCQLAAQRLARRYRFESGETDRYAVSLTFPVQRPGRLTGFKGYFTADLADAVSLDISGDSLEHGTVSSSWKHCYLPIEEPVEVRPRDQITLEFSRSHRDTRDSFRQGYGWEGRVWRDGTAIGSFAQHSYRRGGTDGP